MIISDIEQAKEVLENVSYFRLAGYWLHLTVSPTDHQFKEGSYFADVLDLYLFDKELRVLVFTAIQTIEVTLRTKMIKHFATKFGAFWFMEEKYAFKKDIFRSNLAMINSSIYHSHEDFIVKHLKKYSTPELPPVWKTLEVIPLGTLSKLYSNFSDSSAKHFVAREFGVNHHKFFKTWMESIVVIRNFCAHHSRLVNRDIKIRPKMPELMPKAWITNLSFRPGSLYPQLCIIVYLLNSISASNTFVADFKRLLSTYPSVSTDSLGFPSNWEQEPLWK